MSNLPEYKKKRKALNIPVTEIQKKDIEKRARSQETTVSDYVRNILYPNQN